MSKSEENSDSVFEESDDLPSGDSEIHQLFAEQSIPAHGPDFWDKLRGEAEAEEVSVPSRWDEGLIELFSADASKKASSTTKAGQIGSATGTGAAKEGERKAEPSTRFVLVGAWLVVIAFAGVLFAVQSGGDAGDVATGPNVSTESDGSIYFGRVDRQVLTSGKGLTFTPNGESVVVVDDAPGSETGCGDVELATLYVQPVEGGPRAGLLPDYVQVKAERVEAIIVESSGEGAKLVWTDYCEGERRATWEGVFTVDQPLASLVRLNPEVHGTSGDPFTTEGLGPAGLGPTGEDVLAVGEDGQKLIGGETLRVEDGSKRCQYAEPPVDFLTKPRRAAWAPDGVSVAYVDGDRLRIWNCVDNRLVEFNDVNSDSPVLIHPDGNRIVIGSGSGSPSNVEVLTFQA